MNESADNFTVSDSNGQKLFQYSLYIINGFLALSGSALIIVVILRNRELHSKDFYLLAGLAGGDACQAIGYLYSGIRRVSLVVSHHDTSILVTPFDCMLEFYNSFFLFGQECSMLMTFCISLDRFLAVKAYNRYRTLGSNYAFSMIAAVYVHCAVILAIGWYASAYWTEQTPTYSLICLTPYAVPSEFYSYHGFTQLLPGLFSIILYVSALLRASAISKTLGPSTHMVENQKQAQLTKNVAVIIFYTFVITTLPFGVIFFFNILGLTLSKTFSLIAPYMWALTCCHGVLNVIIYARKYPKFRTCLRTLLKRKYAGVLSGNAVAPAAGRPRGDRK